MGTYSFEKPELTLTYLRHLNRILTNYGLDLHTLPIIFFQKYIAKYILPYNTYLDVAELEQILCLNRIGYKDPDNSNVTVLSREKYKISDAQKKQENIRSQSKITEENNDESFLQRHQPPKLTRQLPVHEIWF